MELDELKRAWTQLDLRQDGMEALLLDDIRHRHLDRTRASLRRSLLGLALELLAWIAFTVFVASFWVEHRHVTHWLVIGLLLHVYGIACIWSTATQWFLLGRIHLFDAPVVVMQRRLAQLRRFRAWSMLALGLPWWCLWLLVSMVGAQQFAGTDWFAASPGWIWTSLALGVAGMGLSLWLARQLARHPPEAPWLRRMIEDTGGITLRRAARQLDELARFERE